MEVFPNLPQALGMECLMRVPYKYHNKLRRVCKTWKEVMNDPHFYADRRKFNFAEQRVCMIQLINPSDVAYGITVCDPVNNIWERLPPMCKFQPGIIMPRRHCVTVNGKLVLIGIVSDRNICRRMKMRRSKIISRVFLYDFSKSQWRRGADMPIIDSHMFRCAVAGSSTGSGGGLVYVAGGYNPAAATRRKLCGAAAVYSVEEDKWEILPNMSRHIEGQGAFIDGKFYVVDEFGFLEVFDPNLRSWTTVKDGENPDKELVWRRVVRVGGRLYSYGFPQGVLEFKFKESVWKRVAPCPMDGWYICTATEWGDNLFFGGCYNPGRRAVFCMFVPPATEGARFSEIVVESPDDFKSWVYFFTTLYI